MKALSILIVPLAMSSAATASEAWLPESKGFFNAQEVPAALYIDLGDDPEALDRLTKSLFVIDDPEVARSESLVCPKPYKKYLIRSIFLGRSTATVYQEPHRLLISTGSFGSPREPGKGAVAICLLAAPEVIEGATSFLK
ncbi:hypothetical protein FHW69_000820 [Luteibacter sp. Sphag1AF]|uniref:hypothetical protein n=1 Tax=Luteibacter sp. Sphag1AF TaxID=2587031 RepID=UPI00161331F4|nr:hypothetical protein [Luteibacter sp. Sphag1AF]MBB3226230.1 hypothetical protein [Luteibacter sp. Sphag1AF]